jgi:hypothetical protein
MISWVVPTVVGREASLERSLEYVNARDDVEVLIYHDKPTCGEAWVCGASDATGDYIYFAADDIAAKEGFIEAMAAVVDEGYLPAATVLFPDGALQSCGGRNEEMVCRDSIAHRTVVEWSLTPFIKAEWWTDHLDDHRGMLASLHYSSDFLVSEILRRAGIPSMVTREAEILHYSEMAGRGAGMDQDARASTDLNTCRTYCSSMVVR